MMLNGAVPLLMLTAAVLCCEADAAAVFPRPGNICGLPADTGPCRARFLRFFHNIRTGRCEGFTYGGCLGNENNFNTLLGCQQRCGCPKGQDIVNCFADPCQFASCSSFPRALCVADYCGGCNARFFLQGGKEVTDKCDAVGTTAASVCPIAGQEFQQCRTCPATCDNPDLICTLQCQPGCGCPPGELIDEENNRCVKSGKCPVGTPAEPTTAAPVCLIAGQEFQQCRTCPATCDNPDLICTLQCQPGCGCPSGELIDEENNRCVMSGKCPVGTPAEPTTAAPVCLIAGQEFQQCRTCPATCDNPDLICTLQCQPGCGCPSGELIDEENNRCVMSGKCPVGTPAEPTTAAPVCPIAGQEFQQCRTCPATCDNPDLICTLQCQPGCGCPSGELIDEENNRCVKSGMCPSQLA